MNLLILFSAAIIIFCFYAIYIFYTSTKQMAEFVQSEKDFENTMKKMLDDIELRKTKNEQSN